MLFVVNVVVVLRRNRRDFSLFISNLRNKFLNIALDDLLMDESLNFYQGTQSRPHNLPFQILMQCISCYELNLKFTYD